VRRRPARRTWRRSSHRSGVAESDDLVEQGTGPQVRVVGEASDYVRPVLGQGVGAGRATNAGHRSPER